MVRMIDIIDTANLLDKYEVECDYDRRRNQYILDDSEYQRLLDLVKDPKYVEKFVVNSKTGEAQISRMRGHGDTLASTRIEASEETNSTGDVLFTPASILQLLSMVDEFKEFDLGLYTTPNNNLVIEVNDSSYELISEGSLDEITLEVDEETVEDIEDLNESAYNNIVVDDDYLEPIESGIIKEALKTLAIGGLVRLGKSYLTSDKA